MSKKDQKYYVPSEYERYKNAVRARSSSDEEMLQEYSIHNDENFYRLIQAENNRYKVRQLDNKPEVPQPPVNVNKPDKIAEKREYNSVYDRIAEKRNKSKGVQKNKIPVVSFGQQDFPELKYDAVVPVNINKIASEENLDKNFFDQSSVSEEETEAFINHITKIADENYDEEQYYTREDIEEICEYYKVKYSRRMWFTLIGSLAFFCIVFIGMYLYLNGYLDDNLLNLLN